MGVDLSKWGWTEWIGMPVDLRRRRFGLVFSLRNFKNICRQVGVSLAEPLGSPSSFLDARSVSPVKNSMKLHSNIPSRGVHYNLPLIS